MDERQYADEHAFSSESQCLGMFAKYWDVGKVKTRLGNRIGMAASAELHRAFVIYLTTRLSTVAAYRALFVAPDSRCDDFAVCSSKAWQIQPQGPGGLGERMQRFFFSCFQHSQRVVLIGSDCPTVTPARIEAAFAGLSHHDAVLGPAADGGYYLIGLRNHCQGWMERLFREIPWSEDRVAAITRQRLREAGAVWTELPLEEDIDTIDCLRRLEKRLLIRPENDELAIAVRSALAEDASLAVKDAQDAQNPRQHRGPSS